MNTSLNRTMSNQGFRYELAMVKNAVMAKVFKETVHNGKRVSWYNDEMLFDKATPYQLSSAALLPPAASTSTATIVTAAAAQSQRLLTLYGSRSRGDNIKTSKETTDSFAAGLAAIEGFPSIGDKVEVMCTACGE
jgi:hypothetical protein